MAQVGERFYNINPESNGYFRPGSDAAELFRSAEPNTLN